MKKLQLENIEYQWNEDDRYETEGKTHTFASLKKISTFKNNKKYQTVTIKHEHLNKFKEFLNEILEEVPF